MQEAGNVAAVLVADMAVSGVAVPVTADTDGTGSALSENDNVAVDADWNCIDLGSRTT